MLNLSGILSSHKKKWILRCLSSLVTSGSTPEQAVGICSTSTQLLHVSKLFTSCVIKVTANYCNSEVSEVYYHTKRIPAVCKEHLNPDLSSDHCKVCPNHHQYKFPPSQMCHIGCHQPAAPLHHYMVLKYINQNMNTL